MPISAVFVIVCSISQDLDTVVEKSNRRPVTILDEVKNSEERQAYIELYGETDLVARRTRATSFLNRFQDSWLLPQVLEAAAKASFDLGDYPTGLSYARQSLALYPENPLLLVPMAMAQVRRGDRKGAVESARMALDLIDRFARPVHVAVRDWRALREEAERISGATGSRSAPGRREPDTAYAGTAACRSCHAAQFAGWEKTGMARMLRPLDAANVIGDFNGHDGSGSARLTRKGEKFFIDLRRTAGAWDRYRVDYTIGSKWQQAYATRLPSGELHVLPIQYNRLERSWVNYWRVIDPPGSERAEIGEFHRARPVTSYQRNCAPCHTSGVTERGFAEPGVNCEMCHGPSSAHVKGAAPSWRFRTANHRERVEVCAQCHAQSALREAQAFPPRYERRPYTEFSRKAFYRDGRFRETTFIVEAFERSACFKKGEAHCGSCHDPHPAKAASNPSSLRDPEDPDRMCLQCHDASFSGPEHVKHIAASEAARCVSCHMPKIMNSLLFQARTHQIDDRPNAATTARFGSIESPNACLICHKDRTIAWIGEQLRSWQ